MPQQWENGNAARQPAYDESARQNPFAPIDYAARLQNNARQPAPAQPNPYGQPVYDRSGYPLDAQQGWYDPQGYPVQNYGVESYSPQGYQQQLPPQQNAGAPYTASMFAHQPTAVMPSGWQQQPFADQSAVNFWADAPAPVPTPVWVEDEPQAEPEPVYYSAADVPLRDAFTPAAPREQKPDQEDAQPEQQTKQRRPIRVARLLALIAAGVMIAICAVVGGSMVLELMRSEEDAAEFRAAYEEETGRDFYASVPKVDLLPEGEEYPSTPTPEPTIFVPTPKPTPVIPIGSDFRGGDVDASSTEETPEPALRTKLSNYPRNLMRNVSESLRELIKENPEVVGRLVIDGMMDEIVMQRNNTHYLTHDVNGYTSDSGAVFADQSCTFRLPPENLLLRGSSFVPGKVFEPLWQFVSGGSQFAASHMYARLTSLYEDEVYVLFAVLAVDIDPASSRYFNYASNPTFTTDEAMMAYVESARAHSIYNFNVPVDASDRLLTLATISNSDTNLVLMYRMLRDSEGAGR